MKYLKYIVIVLTGIMFISCAEDYLSPDPKSAITAGNYYKTAAELETGLIGVYAAVKDINDNDRDNNHGVQYEFYVTEMRSDNTSTRTTASEDASDAGQLESLNVLTTNAFVLDYYASFYQVIYRANVILANLGVVDDAARAKAIEAEAKFLRGYAYFNLVRLFGDIPLVDRVISPLEDNIKFTRVSTNLIYDLIISDLENAIDGLNNTYKTRASKVAAQGLLAKVYLTLETPDYLKAQILLEDIMTNSPQYTLQSNFRNVFYNELNSEIIFAIGYQSGIQDNSQSFSANFMSNNVGFTAGVNFATSDVVADLDTYGGARKDVSYRIDPITNVGSVRYQVAKFFPDGDSGGFNGQTFTGLPRLAGNDWIVLRFADILLMHVEAIMGSAQETGVDAALISFNKIRARAQMPLKTLGVDKITKDELLLERRVELAFENHRFFDLIRFKSAQNVLGAFAAANNFIFTTTDLLLPIPQRERNLSPIDPATGEKMLKQNPGYN